jgi:3-methylfumaryl-CoA hydratase
MASQLPERPAARSPTTGLEAFYISYMKLSIHNKARKMQGNPSETDGRNVTCDFEGVRRIAAMLDLPPYDFRECPTLPRGWHFPLFGSHTRRSELREDGFPGLGVPMPDLGLPRLLIAARTVTYEGDLPISAPLWRRADIRAVDNRTGANGNYAIVTTGLELGVAGHDKPSVTEETRYFLRGPAKPGATKSGGDPMPLDRFAASKRVVPDDTLLFQFSALGFNSHKIHIDRDHATKVEGYPDLVVNGGLSTLLLTEFARVDLGLIPSSLKLKFTAPLFANRPMTIGAERHEGAWMLTILNDEQRPAVEAELKI